MWCQQKTIEKKVPFRNGYFVPFLLRLYGVVDGLQQKIFVGVVEFSNFFLAIMWHNLKVHKNKRQVLTNEMFPSDNKMVLKIFEMHQ